MIEDVQKRIVIIIDGVRFEIDDTDANAETRKDIARVVKGLLTILEKRARVCAES